MTAKALYNTSVCMSENFNCKFLCVYVCSYIHAYIHITFFPQDKITFLIPKCKSNNEQKH